MELGSSENWRDTLSLAIGENKLDGSALREFFQPLEEWLRNENLRTGQFIGWTYGMWFCIIYLILTKTNENHIYKIHIIPLTSYNQNSG